MKKTIGLLSIFCISAGAMISSGLFVLPGLAYAMAGPSVFLSYLVAGCIALTTVLSLSELVTAMPKPGGDYFYVSRTFGPLFGNISGLLSWLALSLKSAFAIIGIAEIVSLTTQFNLTIAAVILSILFTSINLLGVQEAVRFQVMLVIALVGILVGFFVIGIQSISVELFTPFFPKGTKTLIPTAGFVFVSYGGVLTTASIAGEIKNPGKNIPAGLIGSTVFVTLLYVLVIGVVVGLVPAAALEKSLAPVALAAKAGGGSLLYVLIMIGSLLAFITTANGGILTASRYPVALANDKLFPEIFSTTTRKKQTPLVAIGATGLLISLAVLMNLDLLVKAASTVILLSNIFAHLSVIVMRESMVANYRPTYRAPFYPWLQITGIIAFSLLIIEMGIQPILMSLLFISGGVILYFIRKSKMEIISSALIHLIQRITNRELISETLPDELRRIVETRDEIIRDEFDRAVENSSFIEITRHIDCESLWELIKKDDTISLPFGLTLQKFVDLLKEREAQSSTVISNFVAIPHIVSEGNQVFNVIFIRAREGICFDESNSAVKAVFILIGSRDMRNLHLRALAAIAQVVQHHSFERRWLSARNQRELKDLFLLSKRKRTTNW